LASLVFPDTTVLCNFASIQRLDILTEWLRDRGRWCEAVEAEAQKSANFWPDIGALLGPASPLGEPISIDDEQLLNRIEGVRRSVFGGSTTEPLKHLGEAQTCILITEVAEYAGSWWVTDDADAYEYAQRRHIITKRTGDIMAALVADGDLNAPDALALMQQMSAKGRHLWVPASAADLW